VVDIMWVIDYFVRATLMMKEEETQRLRLLSEVRGRAGEARSARGWRWRIELGMEAAFEDLRGWFLSSQQEAASETAAAAQAAAQLEEEAYLGRPDQSLLPVGWPPPACCPPKKGHRIPDTALTLTGSGVTCCAP
jgi:hypothetical protein